MELIFNELSALGFLKNKYDAKSRMSNFLELLKYGKKEGFNRVRVNRDFKEYYLLEKDYKIYDWLNDHTVTPTEKSFLLSSIKYPYIEENNEKAEESFIKNDYYLDESNEIYHDKSNTVEGLAVALIMDTLAVSFPSNETRKKTFINLYEKIKEKYVQVHHASYKEHFNVHREWILSLKDIVLVETKLESIKKEINLRHDHGKDLLLKFSKKLVKSKYVIKITNSLPFNPKENNFIKKIYPNGLIEIVLIDTDKGYGLILQTTGRNIHETKKIAEILLEQYLT